MNRSLLLAALAVASVAACARGGSGATGDDDSPKVDAKPGGIDAPATPVDAPMTPVDAPPQAVDAPPMADAPQSLFCTANNQCTVPGECCIDLGGPMGFCGPGTIILGECIPQ